MREGCASNSSARAKKGADEHRKEVAKLGFAKAKRGRDGQRNGKEKM